MNNNHSIKYGKIREYNGYGGEIITTFDNNELITYYFTREDLVDTTEELKKDDFVMFKGKTEDVFPQAYYIRKIDLNNMDKSE